MTRYFIDTEFIQTGAADPITLLSIGIVADDGREFYGVDQFADKSKASPWVKTNVLPYLEHGEINATNRSEIRVGILEFVDDSPEFWGWCCGYDFVLLSQLIGFDHWPATWPYYFRDVEQVADEEGKTIIGAPRPDYHSAIEDAREIRDIVKGWE